MPSPGTVLQLQSVRNNVVIKLLMQTQKKDERITVEEVQEGTRYLTCSTSVVLVTLSKGLYSSAAKNKGNNQTLSANKLQKKRILEYLPSSVYLVRVLFEPLLDIMLWRDKVRLVGITLDTACYSRC